MVNLKFVGKSYQFPFAVRPWKCEHLIHKTEGLPEGPDLLAPKEKAKIAEIFFFFWRLGITSRMAFTLHFPADFDTW